MPNIRWLSVQQQNLLFFFKSVYLAKPAHSAAAERAVTLLVLRSRGFCAVFSALCPVSGWVGRPRFPRLLASAAAGPQPGCKCFLRERPTGGTGQPVPQFPHCRMGITDFLCCSRLLWHQVASRIPTSLGPVTRGFPQKQSLAPAKTNSCLASWHTLWPQRVKNTMRQTPSRLIFPSQDGKCGGRQCGGGRGGRAGWGPQRARVCFGQTRWELGVSGRAVGAQLGSERRVQQHPASPGKGVCPPTGTVMPTRHGCLRHPWGWSSQTRSKSPLPIHPPPPPRREGGFGDTKESSTPKPAPSVEMFPGRCLGLLILWDQSRRRPRCLGRGGTHTHPSPGNPVGTAEPFGHAADGCPHWDSKTQSSGTCRVSPGPCPHPCHTKGAVVSRHFPPPRPFSPLSCPLHPPPSRLPDKSPNM